MSFKLQMSSWLDYTNQYRHEIKRHSNGWGVLIIAFFDHRTADRLQYKFVCTILWDERVNRISFSVRLRSYIVEVAVLFPASRRRVVHALKTVARGRGEGRRCSDTAHTMGAGAHDDHLAEVYRLRHMPRSVPLPRAPYHISWIVHASVPTPPWC